MDTLELVVRADRGGRRSPVVPAAGRTRSSGSRRERERRQGPDRRTASKAFAKLTELVDGEPRIVSDPPLIVPIEELVQPARARAGSTSSCTASSAPTGRRCPGDRRRLLERFRYVHAARKVVGVGSVGTRAWIVLMLGRDDSDPLFLQVKEAQASVLEPFLGTSAFSQHGQRVVEGQRLTQAASDIMLGWLRATDLDGVERDFYVRQLWDAKGSAIVETMNPESLRMYARALRRGARQEPRPVRGRDRDRELPRSDPTRLDRALAAFGEAYADQNDLDYDALKAAAASGRVKVEVGV